MPEIVLPVWVIFPPARKTLLVEFVSVKSQLPGVSTRFWGVGVGVGGAGVGVGVAVGVGAEVDVDDEPPPQPTSIERTRTTLNSLIMRRIFSTNDSLCSTNI